MSKTLAVVTFSITLFAAPALAGNAVSSANFKLDTFAGSVDGSHAESTAASFTTPISENFGLQIDGVYGQLGDDDIKGGGLHLFWRDSTIGLLGLTASQVELDDYAVERAGFEGEYYRSNWTLAATAGQQGGDVENDGYGALNASYYLTDNLALSVGGSKSGQDDRWGLGIEYQTPVDGLTIYVNATEGNNSFDMTVAGLRYHFGASKSLKRRHREDDPLNGLFMAATDSMSSIAEARAEHECPEPLVAILGPLNPDLFFAVDAALGFGSSIAIVDPTCSKDFSGTDFPAYLIPGR